MNLAVRITPPVRVSSRTSTVVRELRTSTLRPARVASMTYSRAEPLPASTRTSTKSPFDIPLYLFPIRALSERGAAASEPPQRGAAERGRRLLPGLRPVGERHADRLRRRHRARPDDADRRAAGRPGGPPGQAVRRARWTPPGEGAGRGGIDRRRVYVTNAVKHFRWTRRGKRRLHGKPNAGPGPGCPPCWRRG